MFNDLLVERYRPQILDELVLSPENKKYFQSLQNKKEIPNLLFIGLPGIGKTSLAKIIVKDILKCQYLYINASDESGIDVIRNKIKSFAQTRSIDGKIKICILDEADGLSNIGGQSNAQSALRNLMEEYSGTTRWILTANYKHKIIPALQSRCQDFDLGTPPINECIKRCIEILKLEKIKVAESEKGKLIELIRGQYPDLRKTINTLQKCTISGELHITEQADNKDFAVKVLQKIRSKIDITDLRRYTISNELSFENDYHSLLRGLLDAVFESDLDIEKKRMAMIVIAEGLYQHAFVMDKEISCYSCLLKLYDFL